MEIAHKKVLVVGLGRSGIAAARFLKNKGAQVTVTDSAAEADLGQSAALIREMGIRRQFGRHDIDTFVAADLIVISPGVPHTIKPLRVAQEKGIPITGELELASRFITQPIIAVTGTNGKTTTTQLIADMLDRSGHTVFLGGNIGNPLIGYVDQKETVERVVVEVSSFQLDTIDKFKPEVSVLLNIQHDHLDRYPDFKAYVRSKGRIFENQGEEDVAVLNGSDPRVRSLEEQIQAVKLFFKGRSAGEQGSDMNTQGITFNFAEKTKDLASGSIKTDLQDRQNLGSIALDRIHLKCKHNMENVSAACLAALTAGGSLAGMQSAVDEFKGMAHRMEYVAAYNGVAYYNDSKATNVDAVVCALECLDGPVVLIMGGRNKQSRFQFLETPVKRKVKRLILLGEAAGEIKDALGSFTATESVPTMAAAVVAASRNAARGDAVLLSPACSSFDMYRDYKERGQAFRSAVFQLGTGGKDTL